MNLQNLDLFEVPGKITDSSSPYTAATVSIPNDISLISIHWQEAMEILYVYEGSGIISIDLENFSVNKGDICIVLPNQLHSVQPAHNSCLKLEIIQFPLSLLISSNPNDAASSFFGPLLVGKQVIPWLITPCYSWYPAFCQCLQEIIQLHTFYPTAFPLAIKSKLYQLFYILFYNEPKVQPKSRPQKSVEKTKQIIRYITEHYSEELTMEQMARICGFSESHFMKFFKSTIGITFTECLNSYRLSRASIQLTTTKLPVSTIAKSCGFDNISYFNRLFKRKYGITPTILRAEKKHR